MERIFVVDGVKRSPNAFRERQHALTAVKAYMYSGWSFDSWGTAPADSRLAGFTGFYFKRSDDASGDGFGSSNLLARLASGLHFGTPA